MNAWWAAALAGAVCGLLSGLGIGGGTLLMVWMTGVAALPQQTAQGINLLYFLPSAACALFFHIRNRLIRWDIVQIGLSLKSHDPSQRANGFLTLAGGVVITFAKEILTLITG